MARKTLLENIFVDHSYWGLKWTKLILVTVSHWWTFKRCVFV